MKSEFMQICAFVLALACGACIFLFISPYGNRETCAEAALVFGWSSIFLIWLADA